MTPCESREIFLESIVPEPEIERLKETGVYQNYVVGKISVDEVYRYLKDQGL